VTGRGAGTAIPYERRGGPPAFSAMVHLDLLHAARQLWRYFRLRALFSAASGISERATFWGRRGDAGLELEPQDDMTSFADSANDFDYFGGGARTSAGGTFPHNQMEPARPSRALDGKKKFLGGWLDSGKMDLNCRRHAETGIPSKCWAFRESCAKTRSCHRRARNVETRACVRACATRRGGALATQRGAAHLAKARGLEYPRAIYLWTLGED